MKIDQTRLDQELDFILGQQRELEDMLVPVEQSVAELSAVGTFQQHADIEREHTSVSVSGFLSLYVCVSVCLSVFLSRMSRLSLCLAFCLSMSVCLSVFLSRMSVSCFQRNCVGTSFESLL